MLRNAFALCCALAIISTFGCGPPEVKPPPSAPVKGTVILGGQPMATGEVVFSIAGQPTRKFPVTDGAYSGEAFVGTNKVEVFSYKEGPPLTTDPTNTPTKANIVADQFSYQSTLGAEVTAAGPNEFKFEVTAK